MKPNEQLVVYCLGLLRRGMTLDSLAAEARAHGWSDEDLSQAWSEAQQRFAQSDRTLPPVPKKRHVRASAAEALLFVGGLIVVIGALTMIGGGWQSWGRDGRIFSVIIPTLIAFGLGFGIRKPESQRASQAFLLIASVLLPVSIGLTLSELDTSDAIPMDFRVLFATLSTFGWLAYATWRFRKPTWSLLAVLDLVLLYSSFLTLIGLGPFDGTNAWMWAYVFFGAGLFIIAMLMEGAAFKHESRPVYFVASASLIYTLAYLGISGGLFGFDMYDSEAMRGLTTVLTGGIFLGIGWLVRELRRRGYYEAGSLAGVWDFFGVGGAAGGFMIMAAEEMFVYDVATLAVCAAFIALSIRMQLRQYFQAAVIILAIDVLKIGAERFSSTLGWPVSLMFGGLFIMAAGFALTRAQKQFFPKTTSSNVPPERPTLP